jgi:hypothetical protein
MPKHENTFLERHEGGSKAMSENQQTEPIDANHAQHSSVCGHCGGGTTHETWCITCNIVVRYAYGIVMDAHRLTLGDAIILHALGVEWMGCSL